MKKFFLICLSTLISQTIYCQVSNSQLEETQRYQSMLSTMTKTLVINTTNYQGNTIREFKKELRGWSEKIVSSEIDSLQKTFTIIHNRLMDPKEMEEFLNKHHIKNSTIVSYN